MGLLISECKQSYLEKVPYFGQFLSCRLMLRLNKHRVNEHDETVMLRAHVETQNSHG